MAEPIVSKTCTKCKQPKPLEDFYKERKSRDGHRGQCKDCSLAIWSARGKTKHGKLQHRQYKQSPKGKQSAARYSKSEKGKAAAKRYSSSLKGKAIIKHAGKNYRKRYPERMNARYFVHHQVERGLLPRASTYICLHCKKKQAENWHHNLGYQPEHWSDVIPVCYKCHKALHRASKALILI